MRNTIRLINLNHDARDVARVDAAHGCRNHEKYRIDTLPSVASEEMFESCGSTVHDVCPSAVHGASTLRQARESNPQISCCTIADVSNEQHRLDLRVCVRDCTAAPMRRSS